MANSRTQNVKRNIVAGLVQRMVSIILPFVNRTVILYVLGTEYTGLSGMFSSILEVLNIAELGFNSAIVYSLYKPMADNDEKRIRELVSLFRRIYVVIGTVIFGAGILIMPFLDHLINGTYPGGININFLFLLYLINASASYYLFAYKECLLIADQRKDIADTIRTSVSIARYILQFLILYYTHSFYLYICVNVVGTIITNICIHYVTKQRYPFFYDTKEKMACPSEIKKQVKGLLVDRIGDTCRNSFDNVIITAFFGLTVTAIYGNYYYIYSALYAIMLVMCNAMGASVGNSIVKESMEKNYGDLYKFTYIFSWVAGWCTVCMMCLYQPFMRAWVGDELLLSIENVGLFCLYFYIINMTNIRNQYISGTGIWWKLKVPCICEAIANLFLNIWLGKKYGVTGVLFATIITIFVLNFSWRTAILFKEYFIKKSFIKYLLRYMYYLMITCVATVLTYCVCESIDVQGMGAIILRVVICVFVPNIVFFSGYSLLPEYRDCVLFIKRILK